MENPFVYGEVVPAASFVDRVDELDRLVRDLASGQKVFLISPRRYGKSSLIRHALRAVSRGGALTTEVTVSTTDIYGTTVNGSFDVTVQDTTAPTFISLTASPNVLGDPNHKMVPISIAAVVSDLVDPSPVIELNRAVAVAMRDGPAAGLALIDGIFARQELVDYRPAHAARGELCRRVGRNADARASFQRALDLARQEPERRFLQRRLDELAETSR